MNDNAVLEITVNGGARLVSRSTTVRDVVGEQLGRVISADGTAEDGARLGVAVALNSAVVPRSAWGTRLLAPFDAIEIVTAAQGG